MRIDHHVFIHVARDAETEQFQKTVLGHLQTIGTSIMSQKDQIASLKAALHEEGADIDQLLAMHSAEVAQLADMQAQLATALAAANADSPDIQAAFDQVKAQTAKIAATLPPPAPAPASDAGSASDAST